MLKLTRQVYDAIVAHARKDHPDEACGLVTGPAGSDLAERVIPMLNAERSPTFYRFDDNEWNRVYQQIDDRDDEITVVYHSHTATEAYPSRTDVSYADGYAQLLPNPHYVLVSTRDAETVEFRSYRIVAGEVTEEDVEITESSDT
ncbi:Mov34/MPN/PAD-1 family protein [Fodinicola acaciae]|uniref:Mov34/MPN/PAD-1 family protein n=1 Tax=Fodinicola acaciae TaxID=2681555 RepID=UPI0013CFFE99|nr:M67 family metallopeptidase [Fodinicola acaciae]